jgi:coenzyme F420-0:L-glutamate ligase/coenzyme F420-1:gamma-L-glutamate ligase
VSSAIDPRHGADRLEVLPVLGVPEVRAGDDLAALLLAALLAPLQDGDVVVVSSKVVAKAAGLAVQAAREDVAVAHTDRVVATRGSLRVARLASGLTLAAAGVDESNTEPGTAVPLPEDPDGCARSLWADLRRATGLELAVVVTDTAGRAWREGQTDLAIGVAGLVPLLDLAGTADANGAPLRVTAPAIADEVASAADLVRGKALSRPFAVVRGLAHLVTGSAGPGARVLVRTEADDLFGLGSHDAVRAAVRRDDPTATRGFPAAGPVDAWLTELLEDARAGIDPDLVRCDLVRCDLVRCDLDPGTCVVISVPDEPGGSVSTPGLGSVLAAGALGERIRVLAAARRCRVEDAALTDPSVGVALAGWRIVQLLRVVTSAVGG